MNRDSELLARLRELLDTPPADDFDSPLLDLLGGEGFTYPARSATNLRLLAQSLPVEMLAEITLASRRTAVPDMALNGLERVSGTVPTATLLEVCRNRRRLPQLLTLCGASPFLTGVLCRDPAYFQHLFTERGIDRQRDEAGMLIALRDYVPAESDYPALFPLLRRFKFREMLRIAARDLCGLAPLEEVTAELSALASACLQLAYEVSRRQLVAEFGEPLQRTAEGGTASAELTVIGMGKFGGRELNFSSDIDLIYFYSSDQGETAGREDGSNRISLHAFFVRQAEMISKALHQVTADGFVFRVDLGLRPEGKSGDMACSLRSAEIYYESWGQSWERTAMLKARPVAGSMPLGEQFLRLIEPFIYRKYLDYTLIEDMMAMKKKIDASLAREREGELNIKLGWGGIREIEFFIQALQLVYAGKTPSLRVKNSLQALAALKDARLIGDEDAAVLTEAYRFLRTVEHRIQVVQERQTHSLPSKAEEFQALARRCGFLRPDGVERFRTQLAEQRQQVATIYGSLFLSREEKLKEEISPEIYFFLDHKADPDLVKDMLAERGFKNVDSAYANLLQLRDGPPRVNLTSRTRHLLEQLAPPLLQEIFAAADPDLALFNLDRFLGAIGARASAYALLAENREILKLLVSLLGTSEFLAKIFFGHPELLDSLVAKAYATYLKPAAQMATELDDMLARAEDFEERLDVLRRYRHEEFLRIGLNDIYGKLGQSEIAGQLSDLADTCLAAACRLARQELARFGRPIYHSPDGVPHEADFAVIGMGKLGGRELNYHSDLDIIYIYDRQGYTDGAKQISNHEYFAKLGQKLLSILTTQTREGYVYKLDTRLRPSGNAGPLVTSLDSFRTYHREEAQVWERQALSKARVVVAGEALREGIEAVIRHAVYGKGADEEMRNEIHRLRMRMENEIARESDGNYNIKTGRGGMVDVEFIVQYLQLCHGHRLPEVRLTSTLTALKALHGCGVVAEGDFGVLLNGYKFLRRLENRLRILHDYSMNDLGGSQEYLDKLARHLGYDQKLRHPGQVLLQEYASVTDGVRQVYERILGGQAT